MISVHYSHCHCFNLQIYLFFFFFSVHVYKKRGGALLCLTWSINFSFPRPATSTQGVYLAEMQRGGTETVLRQKKEKRIDHRGEKWKGCAFPICLNWVCMVVQCSGLLTPLTYTYSPFLFVLIQLLLLHYTKLQCFFYYSCLYVL